LHKAKPDAGLWLPSHLPELCEAVGVEIIGDKQNNQSLAVNNCRHGLGAGFSFLFFMLSLLPKLILYLRSGMSE